MTSLRRAWPSIAAATSTRSRASPWRSASSSTRSTGEHDRELALARRAVELRPEVLLGYWILGLANVHLGHMGLGKKALRRAVELSEDGPVMTAQLAWALARGGEKREARERLAALDATGRRRRSSPPASAQRCSWPWGTRRPP